MDTRVKQVEPGNSTIMPHASHLFRKRFGLRGSQAAPAQAENDDRVDFQVIYRKAGLPSSSFTAEEMMMMIASLSPELHPEMKKHTVLVSLGALGKAIGASAETVCDDGS